MTILSIPVRKAKTAIDVDTARLAGMSDEFTETLDRVLAVPSFRYIVVYGLTQTLNDAHASIDSSEPAANIMAAVQKKLDSVYAGAVRSGGTGGGTPADPIEREAVRISWAWWHAKPKATRVAAVAKLVGDESKHAAIGIESGDDKKTREKKAARAIVRNRAALPSVRDEAAANVARDAAARVADSDDMSDMIDMIGADESDDNE